MDFIILFLTVFGSLLLFFFSKAVTLGQQLPLRDIVITSVMFLLTLAVYVVAMYAKAQASADLISNQCGGDITALSVIYFEQEAADILGYCMTGTDP